MTVYKLDSTVNFGEKHKGETIGEILKDDPEWVGWALENIDWFDLDQEAEWALDKAIYEAIEWD